MKKIILAVAVILIVLLIVFYIKGRSSRSNAVSYCKGSISQQISGAKRAGNLAVIDQYKDQFKKCLKDAGLFDVQIEQAVDENF